MACSGDDCFCFFSVHDHTLGRLPGQHSLSGELRSTGFCSARVSPVALIWVRNGKPAGGTPAPHDQGAISSRRRSLVSTMLVAAIAPITLTPANIQKTE